MPSTTYYRATHPNGAVHLRRSHRRHDYAWALVSPTIDGPAWFAADAAELIDEGDGSPGLGIVPVEKIDWPTYAAIRGNRVDTYQITYKGKQHVKSVSAGTPVVGALAYRVACEWRARLGLPPRQTLRWFSDIGELTSACIGLHRLREIEDPKVTGARIIDAQVCWAEPI